MRGQVGARLWNFYFYLMARPGNTLTFSVNQTGGGDCDLYIKAGDIPTRYSYDQRDIGTSPNMNIVLKNTKATTYYAGVYGYTGCSFAIAAYVAGGGTSACPNGCTGHGSCTSQGVCNCQSGWSGVDCSISLSQLAPSRPQTTTVASNLWNYYYFSAVSSRLSVRSHTHVPLDITSTTSVAQITVNQTSPNADCDLYVKQGALPSRFSYDCTPLLCCRRRTHAAPPPP